MEHKPFQLIMYAIFVQVPTITQVVRHLSGEGWHLLCQPARLLPPSSFLLPPSSFLLPPSSFLPRTSTGSSRSLCSPPDRNSNIRIKVIPARHQLHALDHTVPRRISNARSGSECPPRTSTARSGSKCYPPRTSTTSFRAKRSPPDFHHEKNRRSTR